LRNDRVATLFSSQSQFFREEMWSDANLVAPTS
jgi:hypothetical protein